MKPYRIHIVGNLPETSIVKESLQSFGFKYIKTYKSGKHFLIGLMDERIPVARKEVVFVMDDTSDIHCLDVARFIWFFAPEYNIIHVTENNARAFKEMMYSYGVRGVIRPENCFDHIDKCLEEIWNGGFYGVEPIEGKSAPITVSIKFSQREREVLWYSLKGLAVREISEKLEISERTIFNHRQNIFDKAKVNSMQELISLFYYPGIKVF